MSEVRVLVLTPDFPPAPGGVQLVAHRVVRHAGRMRCRVVTLDHGPGDRAETDAGMDVVRVPSGRLDHRVTVARLNAVALREALRFRPHAVLSMHIVAAPVALALQEALHVPFVQYVHADELSHRERLARLAIRRAAAVIAVSRHTRALAARLDGPAARVHVIPNGVDLPSGPAAARCPLPIIVTVARMDELYKGHDTLARALPIVLHATPEARWVVVGDGVLRSWIEGLVTAHGMAESVHFAGRVSDAARDAWLDRAHVFAMPSRVPIGGGGEGYGISYLEAGAHGLPVVAGDVGGAVDAVIHGRTGILVDPTDHVAVATALTELLVDDGRAQALGRAARERARDMAWPSVARHVEDVVLGVASGR
jgi:phosphatidyl-myo-inositol dimannoside synthase